MGQTSSAPSHSEVHDLAFSIDTSLKNLKMESKILSEETITVIQSYLEAGDLHRAVTAISDALRGIEKAPLNIAVAGETGAGKSSFINALRGVGHEEEGAAPTGMVETTTSRTPYKHAKFPNVTLWDLPGIGSTAFQPQDYLKKIKFEEYDFFIIVSSGRFKLSDAELAKAIAQVNRSFYFVRTHVDVDMMLLRESQRRRISRQTGLKQIRNSISRVLQEVTQQEPPVFLVSNFDVSDYDFPELQATLQRELSAHKRHIFRLTLPSVTEATIDQRRDSLKQKLWQESLKLREWTFFPFRSWTSDDVKKLEENLNVYRSHFGLDDASLGRIAEDLHLSVQQLKENMQSPHLFSEEKDEAVRDKLLKFTQQVYFSKTYHLHSHLIDTVASDVKTLLRREELFTEHRLLHPAMGHPCSSGRSPSMAQLLASSHDTFFKDDKMESKILSEETITVIQSYLEAGDLHGAVTAISDALRGIEKAPLNIAVAGETGAGKSSFINALRGVGHEEEGAAPTGMVETTTSRTPYEHAKFPNVTLWDLPGIGSTAFQPQDYLKKIKFEEYDFFIIVSSGRFKLSDAELAKAIAQVNRSFYFVRTHVDVDMMLLRESQRRRISRQTGLKQIRNSISRVLQEVTQQEPPVFLVSNFDVSDYDFPELQATLQRELPAHKRHIFRLTLPSVTEATIDQRRDSLKQKLWQESLKLREWTFFPFRSWTSDDVKKLEENLNVYRSHFGLDDASLGRIAEDLHLSVQQLKENMQSPHLFSEEKDEAVRDKLLKFTQQVYFSKTYHLHSHLIDTVASDVKTLLRREELFTEHRLLHPAMGHPCSSGRSPSMAQLLASSLDAFFKDVKKESKIISEETITLIESHLENENLHGAVTAISDALRDIEKAPLNIAVAGETGAGKSSFINALRGVGHEEEGAAPTGVVETTMTRTPYVHAKFPSVTIWDLPGIGSTHFQPQNYLKEMKFGEYDFFILISATRFKEIDAHLAKAIAKMKMNFYFVRTKVDNDVSNEQRGKRRSFSRENVLKKIRDDTSKHLQAALSSEPPVFLVSNFDVSDYDFPELEATLLRELPAHKRHTFMLSLHNVTEAAIDRKRDFLKQKVFLEALKAGAWATLPLGGLIRDNMEKLEETLSLYRSYFGLDDASLESIAKDFHMSVNELKAHIKSPHLLTEEKDMPLEEKLLKWIELLSSVTGGPLATGLYFRKTFYWQNHFIDTVTSDAKALLNKEELFTEKVGSPRANTTEYQEAAMEH